VTRSLVPRTADYDQTLTDLLSSPYIRYRGRIAYDTVQEVVSRIDLFSGATPDLAAKLLFNSALLREVADAPDEEARHELIDNAMVAAAEGLERQLEEQRATAEAERAARISATEKVDVVEADLVRERRRIAELEEEIRAERTARLEAVADAEAQGELERLNKDHRIEGLENRLDRQARSLDTLARVGRRIAGGAIVIGALAGAGISLGLGFVSGPGQTALVSSAAILVAAAGVAVAFGRKIATAALGGFGLVLGIAAALYDLFKH
jgi:hypothetical protein